ncbi:DUF1310 family protein [Granulicatella sp. UMB5615A]|uniref:DUF1310 family protein n=1 Tax=Granulicatella sp. UMB5615A TaxID=3050606 RepID=UPI0025551FF8|nr:DUF1310 family protein [Granulicatella sp. UMB5615A]MDK8380433.1 DUF1310 family protein [Granulicatella sp. UMB5615B]MDK8523387.1 DUF1310 family protein [Granulicatella sp. UMB5615A]
MKIDEDPSEKDGNVTVKKWIKVFVGFLVGVGVIVGSYKIMEVVQNNEMNHIVKSEEVKEIVENYLKYLDEDALTDKGKIISYQIDEQSIEHNPMGGIMFTVFLNDDSELYVRMTLEKNHETGKIQRSGGGYAKKVKDLVGKKD